MAQQNEFVTDATSEEFPRAVLQRSHEVPVVVDFWAEWCGPCKVLGPLLESLAEEARGDFELVKVDVDSSPDLAREFDIQGIPTVIAFRDGAVAGRFTGAQPETRVRQWLEAILPDELDIMVEAARDAALEGDVTQAAHIFQQVLDRQADHPDAGTGLASLMIARGDTDDALIVLGRLAPTPDVERLQAAARLSASRGDDLSDLQAAVDADPDDEGARLALAAALAGRGEFEPALDLMLHAVRARGERWEEGRQGMLDIFEVLGNEHPLTLTYRRQLANALF